MKRSVNFVSHQWDITHLLFFVFLYHIKVQEDWSLEVNLDHRNSNRNRNRNSKLCLYNNSKDKSN